MGIKEQQEAVKRDYETLAQLQKYENNKRKARENRIKKQVKSEKSYGQNGISNQSSGFNSPFNNNDPMSFYKNKVNSVNQKVDNYKKVFDTLNKPTMNSNPSDTYSDLFPLKNGNASLNATPKVNIPKPSVPKQSFKPNMNASLPSQNPGLSISDPSVVSNPLGMSNTIGTDSAIANATNASIAPGLGAETVGAGATGTGVAGGELAGAIGAETGGAAAASGLGASGAAGAGGATAGLAAAGPIGLAIAGIMALHSHNQKKKAKLLGSTMQQNQNALNENAQDKQEAISNLDFGNISPEQTVPQEEGNFLGKLGEGLGDFALGYKENRDTPFSFDNWKDGADQVQSFKNSINPEDYRTALTPEETESFNTWVDGMRSKGAINPNDQFQDYDMQGYWKNEVLGNTGLANGNAQDHFTDKYKMPNHETFSNESQYYNDDNAKYAGSWNGDQFNAPDVEKSKMMRLGEIMGSAARFANKPAIQGLIAGGLKAANTGNIGDGVEYGMGWAQNKASSDYYAKMLGENPTLLGTLDKDVVKTAIEQQYKNAMMNNMANRNQNDALKTQAYLANVQNQMTNRDRTANLNERKFNYTKQNGSGKNDDFAIRKLIFENQLKALDSSMMNDTEKSLAREQLYNDYNSYLATRGTLMNKGIDPSIASLANIAPNSEEALAQPPKADSIIGDYILMQEDPDFYNSLLNG